jgi:hypothetical protein
MSQQVFREMCVNMRRLTFHLGHSASLSPALQEALQSIFTVLTADTMLGTYSPSSAALAQHLACGTCGYS